ncbi:hypothetical protein [Pseudarthrobacter sp. C1]|uniref:hypothetical protein n=1 Tax=Pseudarthrobacter sp. C1 TaxID=3108940 RepID=UPI002B05A7F2|nr:hypothetical protein [Pseudarthrobacter sp. C1]MEA3550244.1 hypothetical protein [Pseudarthrobacter sp. C1]
MAADGIPFRTLSGNRTRIRDLDVEVNHTTTGTTAHDVSIAGTNTEIIRLNIRNVGTASWRGLGLWAGDGHRIGQYKASNVRIGLEVRSTATNAMVNYDATDVTLHATDAFAKTMIDPAAAPTLRLPANLTPYPGQRFWTGSASGRCPGRASARCSRGSHGPRPSERGQ